MIKNDSYSQRSSLQTVVTPKNQCPTLSVKRMGVLFITGTALAALAPLLTSDPPFLFPPICPTTSDIPLFTCPQITPQPLNSNQAESITNVFYDSQGSSIGVFHRAIEQNDLPAIHFWLAKNDTAFLKGRKIWPDEDLSVLVATELSLGVKEAIRNGNIQATLLLIDRAICSVKASDERGLKLVLSEAFDEAMFNNQKAIINAILCHVQSDLAIDRFRHAAFWSMKETPEITIEILKKGCPIESSYSIERAIKLKNPALIDAFLAHPGFPEHLTAAITASIQVNNVDVLKKLLKFPSTETELSEAVEITAKLNHIECLKELFKHPVNGQDALKALQTACHSQNSESAHFLASQGDFYLNDKNCLSYLIKTQFLPTKYLSEMRGISSTQQANLVEAYLESGEIEEINLLSAWNELKTSEDHFVLLRGYLAGKKGFLEIEKLAIGGISTFKTKQQELLIRIAIAQKHLPSFIEKLVENSSIAKEKKAELQEVHLQTIEKEVRIAAIRQTILTTQQPSPHSLLPHPASFSWNPEVVYQEVMDNGPLILEWLSAKRVGTDFKAAEDPRFKYYNEERIGHIEGIPNLIFKNCQSNEDAAKRSMNIELVRDVCIREGLTHLRIPNAMRISTLPDQKGNPVSVNLVVEERLPVSSHVEYEVKDFLEAINEDPKAREIINGYFGELTKLVWKTGLTDLKPTNVPLLADGSGLAIVDSSMIGSNPAHSIYLFPQEMHALAHWISPDNLKTVGIVFDQYQDWSFKLTAWTNGFDRTEHEIQRDKSYALEQQLHQMHLKQYGLVETDPIELSSEDLEEMDLATEDTCKKIVQQLNQKIKSKSWTFRGPRNVLLTSSSDGAELKVLEHLVRRGKIFSATNEGKRLLIQC